MDESSRILIVNADDFGRSKAVNRGVAIAHEKGIVTSASLMVRRQAAKDAAVYASEHSGISVGLHVDLGEWIFRDGSWAAVEEVSGPLEEEVERQLAEFVRLVGRQPTHVDSHQHVHREEAVRSVLAGVARDLGIPLRGHDARVRYCGSFYGQSATGDPLHTAIGVESLVDLLAALPAGVTELGCHPGIGADQDCPYGRERAIELEALCDPRVRDALLTNNIKLSSFATLNG
jgi:chitin disaccharide deacetylase